MNKKIILMGLSIAFIFSFGNNVYAADGTSKDLVSNQENQEDHTYIYEVIKISDKKISLLYQGEVLGDTSIVEEVVGDTNLTLDKAYFPADVSRHDKYEVKSKDRLGYLKSENIKKEDISLKEKYKKPTNMAKEDLPKGSQSLEFVIEKLEGDKEIGFEATIAEATNKENKYFITSDDLRDENPKVGDKYTIYWDGISLESYPAQFGQIYRVEKDDQVSLEFEIDEIIIENDKATSALIFEKGNKENLFSIDFEELKDQDAKAGDRYKITWDGTETKSIPALFGEIFEVEKTFTNKEEIKDTAEFELVDISDSKEGGDAHLKKNQGFGQVNLIFLSELKDDNPAIGDKYLISYTKDIYGQIGSIKKIEKLDNNPNPMADLEQLKLVVDEADQIVLGDGTYTKASAERFQKAFENAKEALKKSYLSQEEADKIAEELMDAMDGLTEKTGVISRIFVLTEIGEKAGKFARLTDADFADKEFTTDFESLGDPKAKVGDHFQVTMEHVDPEEEPYQMGKVTKIERVANYSKLIDTIEKAEKAYDKNKTYTKESQESYQKALEKARSMIYKNSLDSPDNVDQAISGLEKAIEDLKEVQKEDDKKAAQKGDGKIKFGKGWNPKTGVPSLAPLLLVIGGASILLKKKK